MALDLPESDWKAFKKLREVALERLCERILKGVGPITTDNSKSFHARYLSLFEFIQEQDDHIARAFNNPRRSTAVMQLVAMATLDLVKPEELSAFTPRTQAVVEALSSRIEVPMQGKAHNIARTRREAPCLFKRSAAARGTPPR